MEFLVEPYVGVGPVKFGMTPEEVRDVLKAPFKSYMKTSTSEMATDGFNSLGLHVYYRSPGVCKAVEVFCEPPHVLVFRGELLFGRPYEELLRWFRTLDAGLEPYDMGVDSPMTGVSLYAPDGEDHPEKPIESVLVVDKHYWKR